MTTTQCLTQDHKNLPIFDRTGFFVGLVCCLANFPAMYLLAFYEVKIYLISTLPLPLPALYFYFVWPILTGFAAGRLKSLRLMMLAVLAVIQLYWAFTASYSFAGIWNELVKLFTNQDSSLYKIKIGLFCLWFLTAACLYALMVFGNFWQRKERKI